MTDISTPTQAHQATPNAYRAHSQNDTRSDLRLVSAWPDLHAAKKNPKPEGLGERADTRGGAIKSNLGRLLGVREGFLAAIYRKKQIQDTLNAANSAVVTVAVSNLSQQALICIGMGRDSVSRRRSNFNESAL